MNTAGVICYIPAGFKFDVQTPWRWHRRVETCRGLLKGHTFKCVLQVVDYTGFITEYIFVV